MFHLEIQSPVPDQNVAANSAATAINLGDWIFNEESGPIARFVTNQGNLDILLLEHQAPLSVANFVGYVTSGKYNDVVVHRSVPGFVVQTGGYNPSGGDITPPGTPTVPNEFSPTRSNVRGTIAYAKLGNDPNSATSEWFVNLADNNASNPQGNNLDAQNSGFTVFGRVIHDTMTTADAIAALPRTRHSTISAFSELPVTQTFPSPSTPSRDFMVIISSATMLPPPVTFTVTSSDPTLVQPVVNGENLTLNYAAGRKGVATITVSALEEGNPTPIVDVFDVNVGLFNTVLGNGGSRTVTYVDADGTRGVITTRGGTASVRFEGENITQEVVGPHTVVSGQNLEVFQIGLSGDNPSMTVTGTGGDGRLVLKGLSADSPVRAVNARSSVLKGTSNFAQGIGRLDVLSTEDASITIGGDPAAGQVAGTLDLGNVDDTDIASSVPIRSIRSGNWTNGDAEADVVSAPALTSILAGDLSGTFNAGAIRSIRANTVTGATINLSQPAAAGVLALGSMNVRGSILNSTVNSVGNIGSVVAGALTGSNVYAGVTLPDAVRLPAAADVFTSSSGIRALTVRNRTAPSFVNSVVAASVLGRMNLGLIQTDNAGTPMGLAAALLQSISAVTQTGTPVRAVRLEEPSQSIDQGDFEARIF